MSREARVVVTGLGVVSSAGIGLPAFWAGMTSGRSFVRRITRFDASHMAVQIASEIDDAQLTPHLNGVEPTQDNRIFLYSELAADMAFRDSGLSADALAPLRTGVVVGTSVGPSLNAAVAFMEGRLPGYGGEPKENAVWSLCFPAELGRRLNQRLRLQGFSAAVSTGCASGADAIGVALEAIEWGHCDVMFAIGAEAPIEPLTINAFDALGALSHRNADPSRASRPFDRDRDGFVLGEGAAVLVMERLELAEARHARIYGELRSYVTTTDAHHMTAPRHDLSKARLAVARALADGGVTAEQVNYISAHATSTGVGDLVETRLIKRSFGDRAYAIPISSTKSIIGHQSGGAGAFQAVTSLLSLQEQLLVPTVNLAAPSDECDLDYVPHAARPAAVRCVLQQTFGFSGKNSMIVLADPALDWAC